MSDTVLPFELLATNASVIVRVTLPGNVSFDAEFSLVPAGVSEVTAELLLAGGLRVSVIHNGNTISRFIPSAQLPEYKDR